MNISVFGAGNSGLAMAAHLSRDGHRVVLWNRSKETIEELIETPKITAEGMIEGTFPIDVVTDDIKVAVEDPDLILITTPANAHRELAEMIAKNIKRSTLIVLNPGRTFGALEFREVYAKYNKHLEQDIAETQTIVYTCRKTGPRSVNVVALKADVLLSTFNPAENQRIIAQLPTSLRRFFIPARSLVETSIGNVGMILHSAPLLLNTGWTENEYKTYKYYYDGITPSISRLIEKLDEERVAVSKKLGCQVERTKDWLKRSYGLEGENLFDVIQKNDAYKTIEAPAVLNHRYIMEDVPYGLVPLEAIGKKLNLRMQTTSLIIDLASSIMEIDFRKIGRTIQDYNGLLLEKAQ
ncbi:MAG TPA: NAD(P)-binding domain-containing protein [Firmicutes bacterium]|nr:NAD(P)-binding domain-containing protein [Bacillota bacterium]